MPDVEFVIIAEAITQGAGEFEPEDERLDNARPRDSPRVRILITLATIIKTNLCLLTKEVSPKLPPDIRLCFIVQ